MTSQRLEFVLAALIFIIPVMAVLLPKSLLGPIIALALAGWFFRDKRVNLFSKNAHTGYLILAFILYGFLSTLWSIDPLESLKLALKLCALSFISVGLGQLFTKNIFISFVTGHTIACIYVLASELFHFHVSPIKTFIQGGLFLSLSFWIALYALVTAPMTTRWRIISLLMMITVTMVALHHVHCDTAGLGVILGGVVAFLLAYSHNATTKYTLQFLIILAFLLTPSICFYAFKPDYFAQYNTYMKDPSYLHRIKIWHETAIKIAEKPILGYGLNTSRHVGDGAIADLEFTNKNGMTQSVKAEKMGMHPHNIALQLWLELGVVGALLGGIITAFFFGRIYHIEDRAKRLCFFGFFTSTMFAFWVNIGAFQTWWLSSIILLIHLLNIPWKNKIQS